MLTIGDCVVVKLNPEHNVQGFSCQDKNITNFIKNKSQNFNDELLSITYVFIHKDDPTEILAYYTVSNDALVIHNLPRTRKERVAKNIPFLKRYIDTFPAIKIGMLGRHERKLVKGSGPLIINHIIGWIVKENTFSACRFIVVDAHNVEPILKMYSNIGFQLLFSSETQEKEYFKIAKEKHLETRYMFYDILPFAKQYKTMLAENNQH